MKPFNLQAALEGKPVVTRSGEEAVFLLQRTHPKHKQFPLVFSIGETQDIYSYRLDGMFHSTNIESSLDLFMAGDTFSEDDTLIRKLEVLERLYKIAVDGGAVSQASHILEEIEAILDKM